jgi:hypothetical protein
MAAAVAPPEVAAVAREAAEAPAAGDVPEMVAGAADA